MQLCSFVFCHLLRHFIIITRYIYIYTYTVTRRVKGYTRFVGKYVPGPIRNTSRVDLAMSVCPSVRMNAVTSRVDLAMSVCPSVRLTSRVDLAMSVCPSVCPDERWDLVNFKS